MGGRTYYSIVTHEHIFVCVYLHYSWTISYVVELPNLLVFWTHSYGVFCMFFATFVIDLFVILKSRHENFQFVNWYEFILFCSNIHSVLFIFSPFWAAYGKQKSSWRFIFIPGKELSMWCYCLLTKWNLSRYVEYEHQKYPLMCMQINKTNWSCS